MIYLFDLEYVETRYTAQWKTELPQKIADTTGSDVTIIAGPADIDGEEQYSTFSLQVRKFGDTDKSPSIL